MHSTDVERLDTKSRAIEDALSRIGEPITEAQAKDVAALEDCECKDGMFALAANRRQLFAGTGLVAAVGMTAMLPRAADAKAPARRGRVPGASRFHQGTGPYDGGGRRLRLTLAIRDRSSLGEPDQDGGIFASAEQLRHHHAIRAALRAPSRRHPEYRPGRSTASSSTAWSTGPSNIRSPISSASRLCRVPISWNVPARPAARS